MVKILEDTTKSFDILIWFFFKFYRKIKDDDSFLTRKLTCNFLSGIQFLFIAWGEGEYANFPFSSVTVN